MWVIANGWILAGGGVPLGSLQVTAVLDNIDGLNLQKKMPN